MLCLRFPNYLQLSFLYLHVFRFFLILKNSPSPFYLSFLCAAVILPVVKKQHQLLVTLLLCNACAMEVNIYLLLLTLVMVLNFNSNFF